MPNKKSNENKALELLRKTFPDMSFALLAYSQDNSMVRTNFYHKNLRIEDLPLMSEAASELSARISRCTRKNIKGNIVIFGSGNGVETR